MVQPMGNWRQSAAAALADTAPTYIRTSAYGLPTAIEAGLRALAKQKPPRLASHDEWHATVADAIRLASEGWATTALSMGWTEHDVFGIGPHGSNEWLSLAVWIAGRSIVAMDDHRALTVDDVYYLERWGRPNTTFVDPVMLWEIGR